MFGSFYFIIDLWKGRIVKERVLIKRGFCNKEERYDIDKKCLITLRKHFLSNPILPYHFSLCLYPSFILPPTYFFLWSSSFKNTIDN